MLYWNSNFIFSTSFYFTSSTDRIVLSFNGGKDCTVLLDLVARVFSRFPEYSDRKIKTVYVRDNDPFSELESFVKSSLKRYLLRFFVPNWRSRYPFLQLYTYDLGLKEAFLKFSDDFSLKDYAILIGVRKTDPFCRKSFFDLYLFCRKFSWSPRLW